MPRRLSWSFAAGLSLVALALLPGSAHAASVVTLESCGWQLRSDPVIVNVLYPDQAAVYYVAELPTPPPGVSYRIEGEFPHSRYMSFTAYNGLPMDHLPDVAIPADAGSSNPFIAGASRTVANRSYTVQLVDQPAPSDPAQRQPGALYIGAGQHETPAAEFYLMYRIYVPDQGSGLDGGVPLPQIEAVGPGAQEAGLSATACQNAREMLDNPQLEELQWQEAQASLPANAPESQKATNPPEWSVSSGLANGATGSRLGLGEEVSGGPGSNPDNEYVSAPVSTAYGRVIVMHGKAPTTPKTYQGQPVMGRGDLRYWSICQNSRTTRYIACLADYQVKLERYRYYTIVVSDPAHRPSGARNWIPYGPEPEAQLIYRHMLPSKKFFPYSAQGVAASGKPIEEVMGAYYPRTVYCTTAQFEEDKCGL
jgi:hypothetical protein